MGCIGSKHAVAASPKLEFSVVKRENGKHSSGLSSSREQRSKAKKLEEKKEESMEKSRELAMVSKGSSVGKFSLSSRLGNVHKNVEGEQIAAGWPSWLSAVASDAIRGWLPLNPEAFEKLEKIGHGTYSSVYRAREVETGRVVALKKVRFDNLQPESIRFMSREIKILRRLDHPNIMKLDGIITSPLSSTIYLVFEYMEHDLAGLLSNPDIKFSEPQIKCYMHQLLSGLEHCHKQGVMHRDIKTSNILLDNKGMLKVADFGLANTIGKSEHRQPLTSRVVTLWYRPPELLLGSTNYGVSVDLWSAGCVFAEILIGKPVLKGRTEVEQLHKIFKLCGSPPEEYWKKSKLPLATMFKPQHPYESSLRERCKDFPATAVKLIETFLSIEPHKRGTASSAIISEYFSTKPYACDPSSLPKYPPNKEMDAKLREDVQGKKTSSKTQGSGASGKPKRVQRLMQEANCSSKPASKEVVQAHNQLGNRTSRTTKVKGAYILAGPLKSSFDTSSHLSQLTTASQGDIPYSGRPRATRPSSFALAKKRDRNVASIRPHIRSGAKSQISAVDQMSMPQEQTDSEKQESEDNFNGPRGDSKDHHSCKISRHRTQNCRKKFVQPGSFDSSDICYMERLAVGDYNGEELAASRSNMVCKDQKNKVEYSGPLLSLPHKVDELLQRRESHIRRAAQRQKLQRRTEL